MSNDEMVQKLEQLNLEEPASLDLLINFLEHGEPLLREVAFDRLKQAKVPTAPTKISQLFRSEDAYVRNAAVLIMACLWDLSKDELTKLLHDSDEDVRKLALDSLHLVVGDPSVVDLIAEGLKDPDINNLIATIEYITDLGGSSYAGQIADILIHSEDEFLSSVCLRALSEIGDEESIKKVLNFFPIDQLNDVLLLPYLRLLARFPEVVNFDLLIDVAQNKWQVALKEILDVFRSMIDTNAVLNDEQRVKMINFLKVVLWEKIPSANKYEIVMLLSKLKDESILKELVNYLYHTDPMIRIAAIEIIGQLRLDEYIEDLEKIYATTQDEDLKLAIQLVLFDLKGE